jgi:hypothetical protein
MPQKKKVITVIPDLRMENARLIFRNFSGKEGRFNAAGRRNFCVPLEKEVADELVELGWNIKWLQPREEGDEPQAYIQVTVSYKNKPPKVIVVTETNKTFLEESTIHVLDWAEIKTVDLIVRPYEWEVNGKTGIKAYLKTMYITLIEDEFAKKYVDVPDAAIPNLDRPGD